MTIKLREFGIGVRLGLTGCCIAIVIGLITSAMHLYWHYERRDERAGLTIDDLKSAYHGIDAPSPLIQALERGHPETLAKADQEALLAWLKGDKVGENYDNLDLGDAAPAEIVGRTCLSCHARNAGTPVPPMLDYWDDVKKVAFAVKIEPVPVKIVAMSAHAHALSMAPLTALVGLLAIATAFPRKLTGGLFGLAGVGLALDLGAWWLARMDDRWVYVIAAAGGVYNLAMGLMVVITLLELWRPKMGARP